MRALIPSRRKRAVRTMADMGMSMAGMKMDESGKARETMPGMAPPAAKSNAAQEGMPGMDMPSDENANARTMPEMPTGTRTKSPIPGSTPVKHGPDSHGPGNSVIPDETRSRLQEPGIGLGDDGRRVLVYTDLKRTVVNEDQREPTREIELHLTGNMERYMWSINGKKYSEDPAPILFNFGERLRITFVNDTMMEHPMHLHGMWMHLENGTGRYLPRKHTIIVKPAERLSVAITADAPGKWAFHCHMLLHMEMGMFRVVQVS
jgi:FtsP/CotA-like multicopper oxidase with cupredoxin domain